MSFFTDRTQCGACLRSRCRTQGSSGGDVSARNQFFAEGIQPMHLNYLVGFHGNIPFRGGIPLITQGTIICAIGCSGGTDSRG
jgi:glc operon protein GlcG